MAWKMLAHIVGMKGEDNLCRTGGTLSEDITCELSFLACQSMAKCFYDDG